MVVATGSEFVPLGVPGEAAFAGRGLHHAAFELAARFAGKLNTELSAENYSLLEADYLLFDNYERSRSDMEQQPTFASMEVVRTGGLIPLDPIVSDAVSMPNPLTIPFVLSQFVEQINQAETARGR